MAFSVLVLCAWAAYVAFTRGVGNRKLIGVLPIAGCLLPFLLGIFVGSGKLRSDDVAEMKVWVTFGVASRRRSMVGVLAFGVAAAMFAWGAFVVVRGNQLSDQPLLSSGVVFKVLFAFMMLRGAIAQQAANSRGS